ncbi:rRNA pseudouridine synthase [bacterium]|nr:rRNA pseudouridine synthase [bacterium]
MSPGGETGTAGERLQKFLARAGVGSRRQCEQLIVQGRVNVNGEAVRDLGVRVLAERDSVNVDGVPVKPQKLLYLVINKPKNCMCTSRDDLGRRTVLDFLPGISQRVYTVGRLDYDAEGLLILTNDGDFAQRVIHPRFRIPRTYRVAVKGFFTPEAANSLRRGVKLDGKLIRALRLRVISRSKRTSRLELEVSQGINQQVKRMLRRVGYEVTVIKRTRIGKVELASLPPGKFRRMSPTELSAFPGP